MRKIFLILFLGWVLCISVFSQEARKIDEFVPSNCGLTLAYLDHYAIEVQNEPESIAYIIYYDGKINTNGKKYVSVIGEARQIVKRLEWYLTENRAIPRNRIAVVNGGFREENSVELWLSFKTTATPKTTPTLKNIKYRKGSFSKRWCDYYF